MGLFDTLAKQAMGGIFGGAKQGEMLAGLMNEAGGLSGLMERFQQAGLGEVYASWVSTSENRSIQPSQLQSILGNENIQHLAAKVGFDVQMLLPLLSQFLPQIIDKLTPNGAIEDTHPSVDKLQDAVTSVMKSGLGSFFGGRS